ncbi:MAG TPA: filamentous hemagglutinin N-terminal domain-containing protein, partial [Candidatus Brocadiia bacterium]|nr:filamentous hemagglutinin N-terminal domain-containing protein [Candidatus Brocadiia bacterium]
MNHGQRAGTWNGGVARVLLTAAWVAVLAAAALAAPTGQEVVSGSATFTQNGASTVIQAANNTIINYQSFNIAGNESVQFIQPSSTSRVLNRILTADPTVIAGTLRANGIVYIVNPAGVYFSQGALVDVGGIYAAAANISNADFLNGIDRFTNAQGAVVNEGVIKGDAVHLIGRQVSNLGTIVARNGLVTMSAGKDVYIGEQDGHILVKIEADGEALNTGVYNAGQIDATGGKVIAITGDVYSIAIQNTGAIAARDITLEGGDGAVVQVGGSLDASNVASGEKGGTIKVLGEYVWLDGANINASGDAGGGTVLIGGDFQGANAEVRNALRTYVDPNTTITADALTNGDGGRLIIWADEITYFGGSASLRGGAQGGNGGFAEVSGKQSLLFDGLVDLRAPLGVTGSLLLDPDNIDIVAGAANSQPGDALFGATNPQQILSGDGAGNVNVSNGKVIEQLQVGNVLIQAATGITVSAAIDDSAGAGNDLALDAVAGLLDINASITLNNGNLTLNGGGGISVDAALTTGGGNLTATGASTFTIGGAGSISTGGGFVDIQNTGAVTITGTINAGAGAVTIDGNGAGAASITGAGSITTTGLVTLLTAGAGDIGAVGDALDLVGAGMTVNVDSANGGIYLTHATGGVTYASGAAISTTGAVSLVSTTDGATMTVQNGITSAALTLTSADALTVNGALAASGAVSITADTAATGGAVTLGSTLDAGGNAITIIGSEVTFSGGAGSISNSSGLTLRASTAAADIDLGSAAGAATFKVDATDWAAIADAVPVTVGDAASYTGTVTIAGALTNNHTLGISFLNGGGGDLVVNNAITGTGSLTVTGSGGTTTIAADITQAAISITDDIIISGAGSRTLTSTSGGITLDATGVGRSISADNALSNLVLQTNAGAGQTISVSGPFDNAGGQYLNNLTMTGNTVQAGTVTFNASGDINGTLLIANTAAINLATNAADFETAGQINMTGPVTLTGATDLRTAGGAGDIILITGTVAGGNNTLSLNGNAAGSIEVTGAITGIGGAGATINSGSTVSLNNLVTTAGPISVTGSSITLTGTTYTSGDAAVTFTGPVTLGGGDTAVTSGGGAGDNILFSSSISGGNNALTLNGGGGGNVTVQGSATGFGGAGFAVSNGAAVELNNVITSAGAIAVTGGGITLDGTTYTSADAAVGFTGPVTLAADIVVTSGGGAGDNIAFSSTVDGAGRDLTMNAGAAGTISVGGALGGGGAMDAIRIMNAAGATFSAGVTATSFTQNAGTGTTTFNGLINLSGLFDFTGAALTIGAAGANAVGGSMDVTNAGVFTTAVGANLTVGTEFTQDGAGTNSLGGNISSTNDGIAFATAITLTNPVVLTSAGGVADDIILNSTVDGAGQGLTLNAGAAGIINVAGAIGGGGAIGALQVTNSSGTTFGAAVTADSFT